MGGNEKENKNRVIEKGTRQASSQNRVPGTQPRLYSQYIRPSECAVCQWQGAILPVASQ